MITKGDIVNGTLKLMRINGLTTNASPENISDGIQVLDDYMGELSIDLPIPYVQPTEYGKSDPDDTSGLTPEMAGPVKKSFLEELCAYFGKPIPQSVLKTAHSGMRALENLLVNVEPSQNPATLPIGSGNEWDYRSDKFYPEPNSDEHPENAEVGEYYFLTIDWSSFILDDELTAVTYDVDSSITLSEESIESPYSTVKLTFVTSGTTELCVTGTKGESPTDERIIKNFTYSIADCRRPSLLSN